MLVGKPLIRANPSLAPGGLSAQTQDKSRRFLSKRNRFDPKERVTPVVAGVGAALHLSINWPCRSRLAKKPNPNKK